MPSLFNGIKEGELLATPSRGDRAVFSIRASKPLMDGWMHGEGVDDAGSGDGDAE